MKHIATLVMAVTCANAGAASDVKVGVLGPDYKPWSQGNFFQGRTGLYVFVYPDL